MNRQRRIVFSASLLLSSSLALAAYGCGGDDTSGNASDAGGPVDATSSDVANQTDGSSGNDASRTDPGVAISVQSWGGCAVKAGAVECWGDNSSGERGTGSCIAPSSGVAPIVAPGFTPTLLGAGGREFACAAANGGVGCWGNNSLAQLGHDPAADVDGGANCPSGNDSTPQSVPGMSTVTGIGVGYDHACAITGGQVMCWGDHQFGATGGDGGASTTPTAVQGTDGATEITAGGSFACVLKGDGSVWCWGENDISELARAADGAEHPTAAQVTLGQSALQVSAGGFYACALLADHTVSCWGYNGGYNTDSYGGELGHDPTSDPNCFGGVSPCGATPTTVTGLANVREISAGYKHACAVLATDDIQCWGMNGYGELGHDPSVDSDGGAGTNGAQYNFTPITVTGMASIAHVFAGDEATCAVTWDGKIYCWGASRSLPTDAGPSSFIPTLENL